MKSNPKTFLFLGRDKESQQKSLEVIQLFLKPANKDFNYNLVFAKDFKKGNLGDLFFSLPVNSEYRIVHLKDVEALAENNKTALLDFLKKPLKYLVLILETENTEAKNSFLQQLSSLVDFVYTVRREREINAFDLCNSIMNKNTSAALRLLKELRVDAGNAPQIMGAIIWKLEQTKHLLKASELERNFKMLYEADKRIKTGKLKADLALEMLVISLTSGESLFL